MADEPKADEPKADNADFDDEQVEDLEAPASAQDDVAGGQRCTQPTICIPLTCGQYSTM